MPHADPEKRRAYQRRYHQETHRVELREKALARYYENHEESKASHRAWYKKNVEKCRAYSRDYQKKHGTRRSESGWAKAREYGKRHRLKLRLEAILKMGSRCETCGISDERVLQFDHREPVRRKSTTVHVPATCHRQILKMPNPRDLFALLCANCHIIKTRESGEYSGSRWGGRRKVASA